MATSALSRLEISSRPSQYKVDFLRKKGPVEFNNLILDLLRSEIRRHADWYSTYPRSYCFVTSVRTSDISCNKFLNTVN